MAERVVVATPIASAGGRVIAAPFQFYTTGEDSLRVVIVNSKVGVTVGIRWRFLGADAVPNPTGEVLTPTANRVASTRDFPLSPGVLLNLTAFAASGSPQTGQTFVIVQLIRGQAGAALVLGTLLAAYVTGTQHIAWPGTPIVNSLEGQGVIRTITGTAPGAGNEINETVPTGARWQLVYFQSRLTPDATVLTRSPRLSYNTGTPAFIHLPVTGGAVASTAHFFAWSTGSPFDTDHSSNVSSGGLPSAVILSAGQVIATNTENLQPGDTWDAPTYGVQEWIDV